MRKQSVIFKVLDENRKASLILGTVMVITAVMQGFGLAIILPLLTSILEVEGADGGLRRFIDPLLRIFPEEYEIGILVLLFASLIALKNIFTLLENYLSSLYVWKLRERLMTKILDNYVHSDFNTLIREKQGVLVNNLVYETQRTALTVSYMLQFISRLALLVGLYFALIISDWKITLSLSFVALAGVVISKKFSDIYSLGVGETLLELSQKINTLATENIAAIRQVKTFSLEDSVRSFFGKQLERLTNTMVKFEVLSKSPQLAVEAMVVFTVTLTVIYIHYYSETTLISVIPLIGVFMLVGQRLFYTLAHIFQLRMSVLSGTPSLELVYKIAHNISNKENVHVGDTCGEIKGDIELQNIAFGYDGRQCLFECINLKIPARKTVAIIGASGSGKSTICDLLLGLVKPDSGVIFNDGEDISRYSLASWRKRIGFVSQETFLFNDTIMENIRIGRPSATDEEIIEVAKKAHADEFIRDMPEAYQTMVGDRGITLSGGQRQRIAIARAIVRNPDLFIFDEATSSLDGETEKLVHQSILEMGKEKTVIIIAHRLTSIEKADIVYRIENGRPKLEQGSIEIVSQRK